MNIRESRVQQIQYTSITTLAGKQSGLQLRQTQDFFLIHSMTVFGATPKVR